MENMSENNSVELAGEISIAPELNHEAYEEKFYKFFIKIKRFSELFDEIPIIVSERLIDVNTLKIGEIAHVKGQCRSYNQMDDGKSRLILSVFAKEIEKTEDRSLISLNLVTFIGYICKKPICRKTPLGRDIADVLIAVNRTYKKSDYIPTILWGRNAKFCETLDIGAQVKLSGRIQSRPYEKKLDDETIIQKVAYELSASKLAIYKVNTEDESLKKDEGLTD
jgi:primosomal replication protein N